MLYPVENDFRRLIRLDGICDFVLDPEDRGVELGFPRAFPRSGQPMAVPASYNDIGVDAAVRDHIGPVWYRRSFFVPTDWRGSAVVVRVGAASHHATLYVNGVEVCRHQGGFRPRERARAARRQPPRLEHLAARAPRASGPQVSRLLGLALAPGLLPRLFQLRGPASFGLRAQALAPADRWIAHENRPCRRARAGRLRRQGIAPTKTRS